MIPKNKTSGRLMWAGFAILAVALLSVILVRTLGLKNFPSWPLTEHSLTVRIEFTGMQFVIQNGDDFDWENVEIEINAVGSSSGYKFETPIIRAGQTYRFPAVEFAKDNGERFNAFTVKPRSLTVRARKTVHGKLEYSGTFPSVP